MRLTEITYGAARPVDGYGPGFFRIGGTVYKGALFVLPLDGICQWGGVGDVAPLVAAAEAIDVLLVGTGAEIAPLPPALTAALDAAGVGVETMASPTACRAYNVLLSEGRRVGLAVLPV